MNHHRNGNDKSCKFSVRVFFFSVRNCEWKIYRYKYIASTLVINQEDNENENVQQEAKTTERNLLKKQQTKLS